MDEARRKELLEEFQDKEARTEYADEFLDASVALQIKTLRQSRDWTQQQLAELAGMKQSRISTMEKVDYASWSIKTLRRLARAFDLPLVVRFESWGNLFEDIIRLNRSSLERPTFENDPVFRPKTEGANDLAAVVNIANWANSRPTRNVARSSAGASDTDQPWLSIAEKGSHG